MTQAGNTSVMSDVDKETVQHKNHPTQENGHSENGTYMAAKEWKLVQGAISYGFYIISKPQPRQVYALLISPQSSIYECAATDFLHQAQEEKTFPCNWADGSQYLCTATIDHDSRSVNSNTLGEPEHHYASDKGEHAAKPPCTIRLEPLLHRSSECIAIKFDPYTKLELVVKKVPNVKWTQTHRCWYVLMEPESYRALKKALLSGPDIPDIDEHALREYGARRKAVAATFPQSTYLIKPGALVTSPAWQLSAANLSQLERFIQYLKLKAYSTSTLTTYRTEFLQLLKLLGKRSVDTLTPDDLRRYMVYAMEKEGISEQTAHSRINALKFYFEQVLGRDKFFWEIPRPKKRLILPKVLSERELERLFASVTNLKHKAILFTAYSAGLRVSEVANLKIANIDSERMQILVEQAKGKKDRYVGLSILLLDVLRAYMKQAFPRPQTYLFEGVVPGTPLSKRAAQEVFRQAKIAAGIRKEASFHTLRHSFATHLLEKGIDIKYIKDLLGHFNIKTTERYLHVKREDLIQLVNPLDELYRGKAWHT